MPAQGSRHCLKSHGSIACCSVLPGVIAQLGVTDQNKQSGQSDEAATPVMHMDVDWDLGVSGHADDIAEEYEV